VSLKKLQNEVRGNSDPNRVNTLQRFFKTGPGQYGEGDVFSGLTVPQSRKIAGKYHNLPLEELGKLLHSKIHEERLIALLILVGQFDRGSDKLKKEIYEFYLKNAHKINNWDLVDTSAHYILGRYLWETRKDTKKVLSSLAKSDNLWERRIAIISTFYYIQKGESQLTFMIADILLHDREDLIQKAVGWMLREVGKRCSQLELEKFLRPRYHEMPRTMLRYAIERFPKDLYQKYLKGLV